MAKYKQVAREATLDGAVSDGFSEVESLRDEMEEWADNMEERFGSTEKYERVREAADLLCDVANSSTSPPDKFPTGLDDKVKWVESYPRGSRSPSRQTRLDCVVAAWEMVRDHAQNFLDAHESEDDPVYKDAERTDWENFVDELSTAIDEAQGVEFPGMYG